nr:hypothetical protein 17 [bacterium]
MATTATKLTAEQLDALKLLNLSLVQVKDQGLINGDRAADFFSDVLHQQGIELEQFNELAYGD